MNTRFAKRVVLILRFYLTVFFSTCISLILSVDLTMSSFNLHLWATELATAGDEVVAESPGAANDQDREDWNDFLLKANEEIGPTGLDVQLEMLKIDCICAVHGGTRALLLSPVEIGCKVVDKVIYVTGKMRVLGRIISSSIRTGWSKLLLSYPHIVNISLRELEQENFSCIFDENMRFADDPNSRRCMADRLSTLEDTVAQLQKSVATLEKQGRGGEADENTLRLYAGPFPIEYDESHVRRGFEGRCLRKNFFHLFACIGYNILQLEVVANKFKSKKSAFMTLIATEAERLISRFNGEVFSFGRLTVEPTRFGPKRKGT